MKRVMMTVMVVAAIGWAAIIVSNAQPPEKQPPQGKRGEQGKRGGDNEKGGPGGPGGMRGGRGGFEVGRLIPPPLREQLDLNDEQKQQLDALEKDVKEKLNKLLTEDQRKQLEAMRNRGPGGPGGPGGFGGPGGPGGGPPRGEGKEGRGEGKEGQRRGPPPDKEFE
jgi:hypothetical protein